MRYKVAKIFFMCVNSLNIGIMCVKDCQEFGGLGNLYIHTILYYNKPQFAGRHNVGLVCPCL